MVLAKLIYLLVLATLTKAAPMEHNLPVLFQFSQPSHNVAVFRGADLKKAIAAGIVPGFGSLGAGSQGRDGKSIEGSGPSSSYVTPAPTPAPTAAPVTYKVVTPAPVVYRPAPAPVVYKPAPAPVIYKPAPAPVVYKPSPAPIVYKPAPAPVIKAAAPYIDPYPAEPALYTYEYAVKDDYSNNDFGAEEARDGYLTNGKYQVALPDGRIQTVTYTVDGGNGYVPVVEYAGEAQYPAEPVPTYSS